MSYLLPIFALLALFAGYAHHLVARYFADKASISYLLWLLLHGAFALAFILICTERSFLVVGSEPLLGARFSIDAVSVFFITLTLLFSLLRFVLLGTQLSLFMQAAILMAYISSDLIHIVLWSALAVWVWCGMQTHTSIRRIVPLFLLLLCIVTLLLIVTIVGHTNIANIAIFLSQPNAQDKAIIVLFILLIMLGALSAVLLCGTALSRSEKTDESADSQPLLGLPVSTLLHGAAPIQSESNNGVLNAWPLWCLWMYLLVRFCITMLAVEINFIQHALLVICGLGLFFVVAARHLTLVVRLCILHILIAVLLLAIFTPVAFETALLYLTQATLCTLFVPLLINQTHKLTLVVGALAIGALPPFGLFWTLLEGIDLAATHSGTFLLAVALVALALMYYAVRLLQQPSPQAASQPARPALLVLLLAIATLMVPLALKPTLGAVSDAALNKKAYMDALYQEQQ